MTEQNPEVLVAIADLIDARAQVYKVAADALDSTMSRALERSDYKTVLARLEALCDELGHQYALPVATSTGTTAHGARVSGIGRQAVRMRMIDQAMQARRAQAKILASTRHLEELWSTGENHPRLQEFSQDSLIDYLVEGRKHLVEVPA